MRGAQIWLIWWTQRQFELQSGNFLVSELPTSAPVHCLVRVISSSPSADVLSLFLASSVITSHNDPHLVLLFPKHVVYTLPADFTVIAVSWAGSPAEIHCHDCCFIFGVLWWFHVLSLVMYRRRNSSGFGREGANRPHDWVYNPVWENVTPTLQIFLETNVITKLWDVTAVYFESSFFLNHAIFCPASVVRWTTGLPLRSCSISVSYRLSVDSILFLLKVARDMMLTIDAIHVQGLWRVSDKGCSTIFGTGSRNVMG